MRSQWSTLHGVSVVSPHFYTWLYLERDFYSARASSTLSSLSQPGCGSGSCSTSSEGYSFTKGLNVPSTVYLNLSRYVHLLPPIATGRFLLLSRRCIIFGMETCLNGLLWVHWSRLHQRRRTLRCSQACSGVNGRCVQLLSVYILLLVTRFLTTLQCARGAVDHR